MLIFPGCFFDLSFLADFLVGCFFMVCFGVLGLIGVFLGGGEGGKGEGVWAWLLQVFLVTDMLFLNIKVPQSI